MTKHSLCQAVDLSGIVQMLYFSSTCLAVINTSSQQKCKIGHVIDDHKSSVGVVVPRRLPNVANSQHR